MPIEVRNDMSPAVVADVVQTRVRQDAAERAAATRRGRSTGLRQGGAAPRGPAQNAPNIGGFARIQPQPVTNGPVEGADARDALIQMELSTLFDGFNQYVDEFNAYDVDPGEVRKFRNTWKAIIEDDTLDYDSRKAALEAVLQRGQKMIDGAPKKRNHELEQRQAWLDSLKENDDPFVINPSTGEMEQNPYYDIRRQQAEDARKAEKAARDEAEAKRKQEEAEREQREEKAQQARDEAAKRAEEQAKELDRIRKGAGSAVAGEIKGLYGEASNFAGEASSHSETIADLRLDLNDVQERLAELAEEEGDYRPEAELLAMETQVFELYQKAQESGTEEDRQAFERRKAVLDEEQAALAGYRRRVAEARAERDMQRDAIAVYQTRMDAANANRRKAEERARELNAIAYRLQRLGNSPEEIDALLAQYGLYVPVDEQPDGE